MLSKEDKADVKRHLGKALANKVSKATDDSKRKVNLVAKGDKFVNVDSSRVTAKDWSTKRRALSALADKKETSSWSGGAERYQSNRAGARKTHRERQKTGEAGSKGYLPHRREW